MLHPPRCARKRTPWGCRAAQHATNRRTVIANPNQNVNAMQDANDHATDHQVSSPVPFPYVTVTEEAPSGEIVVRRYPMDTDTSDATDGATGDAAGQ